MKITPTGNRLLIKIIDKEISPGGIIIPKATTLHSLPASIGEIVAAGPGYLEDGATDKWTPCSFKVGQKVLFSKEAGLKIPKEILRYYLNSNTADSDYTIMQENQIYGTIDEEQKIKSE